MKEVRVERRAGKSDQKKQDVWEKMESWRKVRGVWREYNITTTTIIIIIVFKMFLLRSCSSQVKCV